MFQGFFLVKPHFPHHIIPGPSLWTIMADITHSFHSQCRKLLKKVLFVMIMSPYAFQCSASGVFLLLKKHELGIQIVFSTRLQFFAFAA